MVADIFGPDAFVVAAVAAAILLGAQRLPELARSIGRARGEFQRGIREGEAPDRSVSADSHDAGPGIRSAG